MTDAAAFHIKPRTTVFILIAIIFVGLLARVAALQIVEPAPHLRVTESGRVAVNMANGEGFTFKLFGTREKNPLHSFMPPLFPAINYAAIRFFVPQERFADPASTGQADAVRGLNIINIILSTATIPFLFYLAYKLSDNMIIGLMAATALAIYPVYIIMAVSPPSLTLNLFLLLVYLALIARLRAGLSPLLAILAGLVLGLCLLARFMLIGLLPITLIWLWLNRPEKWLRAVGLAGLILLFALLAILPWTIRNYNIHGRLVGISTNGGFVFWNGNNPFTTGSGHEVYTRRVSEYLGKEHNPNLPEVRAHQQPYPMPRSIAGRARTMDELELDRALYQAGLEFIRENPDQWLDLLGAKLTGFWFFRENIGSTYQASWSHYYKWGYVAVLLLALAGAVLTRRQWRSYLLLYLLFAYYTVVYLIYHVQTRYRWEIEALFFILAAAAVWWLFERILERRSVS